MAESSQITSIRSKKDFEEVFYTYHADLCFFAHKMLGDEEDAKNIVQEVFIEIWEKRNSFEITQSIKAYLYRSVNNRCLNHLKHLTVRKKHAEYSLRMAEETESPTDHLEYRELEADVSDALNSLPEQCRKVFLMSRMENLKYKEIAEKLDISQKTVEVHMGKALRILREKLKAFVPVLLLIIIKKFF